MAIHGQGFAGPFVAHPACANSDYKGTKCQRSIVNALWSSQREDLCCIERTLQIGWVMYERSDHVPSCFLYVQWRVSEIPTKKKHTAALSLRTGHGRWQSFYLPLTSWHALKERASQGSPVLLNALNRLSLSMFDLTSWLASRQMLFHSWVRCSRALGKTSVHVHSSGWQVHDVPERALCLHLQTCCMQL